MRKINFYLGVGYAGCSHEEVVEFGDDATDEEIEEIYEDWKNNFLDCSWREVTD